MDTIDRSALVHYTPQEMYALVSDVEAYPEFLPWCGAAVLHWRDGDVLEGSVEMRIAGLRRSFRTRNRMREYDAIDMELVEGPFSHLSGGWSFKALDHIGCKVSLEVEFEVKSRATNRLLGRYFEEICNSLVDAFVRRAGDIYGTGSSGHG